MENEKITQSGKLLFILDELFSANEVVNNLNEELIFLDKIEKNSELKNCTYPEGNITQELYACIDCFRIKNDNKINEKIYAGICIGCAYKCHKDHEIIPLNFKRNFRCDCGNSKFDSSCDLILNGKDYLNESNVYNHNFEGKFCSCEGDDHGNMIQCLHCEDWFHLEHLNIPEFINIDKGELICNHCLKTYFNSINFLQYLAILPFKDDFKDMILKQINEKDNYDDDIKIENIYSENENKKIESKEEIYENIKRTCPFVDNDGKKKKLVDNQKEIENDPTIFKEETNICQNYMKKYEEENKIIFGQKSIFDYDMIIYIEKIIELLCKCKICNNLHDKINYIFKNDFVEELNSRTLIEDKLKEEADIKREDNQNLITTINNSNYFGIGKIRSLPIEKQIELRDSYINLKEEFIKYINGKIIPENVITKEHIDEFMIHFKKIAENGKLDNDET